MKKITSSLFLIIILHLFSCNASKEPFYASPPQEIKSVTFENWTGGRMESGSGTVFVIELEKPLRKNILLIKIYYRNLETQLVQVNETKFRANFHYNTIYQNPQTSAIANKEFHLKANEAVIEYEKDGLKHWYKCTQIKEITPILFP
jgi:hypothetical protein